MTAAAAAPAAASTSRSSALALALVLAAAGYVLLTLLFTWPAARELRTHLIGGPWDGQLFLWNHWWGAHACFELHEDPLFSRHIYHPDGTSLVFNVHCVLPSLLSWPLQQLLGVVPAFNVMVLLTFALAGLGACCLAHEVVPSWRASFLAGTVFAFGPLRVSKILFFNLSQTWLIAFFAFALWRAWRQRSIGWSIAAGVIGACTFWTDYNLTVLAALWGAAFVIHALAARRTGTTRSRLLLQFGATVLVCGALSSPLAWRLLREYQSFSEFKNLESFDVLREATPLRNYFDPTSLGATGAADRDDDERPAPIRQAAYLGYATLALALLGLWARRKESSAKLLAVVALLFLVISLGPELNLGRGSAAAPDQAVRVPLPYRWVTEIPVLKEIRIAHRYGLLAWLALAVAAGIGMAEVLRRIERRASKHPRLLGGVATALACAAVMAEFTRLPFSVRCELPPIPAPVLDVAADPRTCSVLEWPGGRMGDPFFSLYNIVHGKPVHLDGQLARMPDALIPAQRASSVRQLLTWVFGDEELAGPRFQSLIIGARDERRRSRIGWILLSQVDFALLSSARKPWTPKRLSQIDDRMRRAFPEATLTWMATKPEIERFLRPGARKRWAHGTLFAAYRLP